MHVRRTAFVQWFTKTSTPVLTYFLTNFGQEVVGSYAKNERQGARIRLMMMKETLLIFLEGFVFLIENIK